MRIITHLRQIATRTDRRLTVAGAVVTTTALVGGIAFAAAGPDPGGGTETATTPGASTAPADGALDHERAQAGSSRVGRSPWSAPESDGSHDDPTRRSTTSVRPHSSDTADRAAESTVPEPGAPSTTTTSRPHGEPTGPDTTTADAAPSTPGRPAAPTQPPSARPAPTPPPDELEPEPGPDAGQVVTFHDGGRSAPRPPSATVGLDLVEGDAPPPPEVPPVDVSPLPVGGGGIVGNLFGCEASCIVHATLQPAPFSPDLAFDLETNVNTTAALWISEDQPVVDGGLPVVAGWPDLFRPGWVRSWETTIELEYDSTFWITLRVEDTQGNVRWAITDHATGASPTPEQLAANGDGCYFQCIDFGKVEYTDSYDTVVLVIGTDVPSHEDVTFDVAVSTVQPTWSGGVPQLASQLPFVIDQDGGNDVRGHVSGLAAGTTYHVLVKAIDEDGFAAHAVGQFTTDSEPPTDVRVTWERFFVHYDGDAGAWGRGEIAWAWGMADEPGLPNWGTPYRTYGARNQDKIGDGTSIVLGQNTHHWVSVPAGEAVPTVAVNAHENDTHGNHEYDHCIEYRQVTLGWQHYQDSCMTRTNVALAEGLTVADIGALPKCWQFDVPDARGEDRCLVIESLDANDQHASFDALISFHVPT